MKIFWLCCKNKFLSSVPYLNLLKSRCNHCPDSAIQYIHALRTYVLVSSILVYCIGKLGKREGREFESRGLQTHEFFFFSFFPPTCFFISFSVPHEVNKCFPFIIIYYLARYSCIACIMLLKPMLARSPRLFRN